jgi:heme-degrading monooxygenase HmoA
MADMTAEVLNLPLKPGLDLSAEETKLQWEDCLGTLVAQPGARRVLWGRQVEDQDTVHVVVDWDSLESHKAFVQSPSFQPFIEKINQNFLARGPSFFHVRLPAAQIAQGDPFTCPVTEYFSAFFQPDYNSSDYDAQFAAFQEAVAQIANVDAKGLAGGWSLENQGHEALGEGVQGKLFVMFMGWESLADHMKFRESEEFGKVIPHLREGTVARNVRHVEFKEYK